MALELPAAGPGRRAGHGRARADNLRQCLWPESEGPLWPRRPDRRHRRVASAGQSAGQDGAAVEGRATRFLRARIPREDGPGARHRHLFLADADPEGDIRHIVRRALRRRPSPDARHRRRRGRSELPQMALRADDVRSDAGRIRRRRDAARARRRRSIIRRHGSANMSGARTTRSSRSNMRAPRSASAWSRWCCRS